MILLIRKYVFLNSAKNQAAPHIFLILCAYAVITTVYTRIFFDAGAMIIRFILDLIIIAIFIAVELSPLNTAITAFLSPALITAVLTFGAIYFKGDSLLFIYLSCIAMISLTYFSTKSLAVYIITSGASTAIILFVFGINLLGKNFTMVYNAISFIASMGLSALVYTFCVFCVKTLNALTETKNEASR